MWDSGWPMATSVLVTWSGSVPAPWVFPEGGKLFCTPSSQLKTPESPQELLPLAEQPSQTLHQVGLPPAVASLLLFSNGRPKPRRGQEREALSPPSPAVRPHQEIYFPGRKAKTILLETS